MAERGQRVITHHLVLVRFASILGFQCFEAIEIEEREAGIGDRSEIAVHTILDTRMIAGFDSPDDSADDSRGGLRASLGANGRSR